MTQEQEIEVVKKLMNTLTLTVYEAAAVLCAIDLSLVDAHSQFKKLYGTNGVDQLKAALDKLSS